MRPGKHVLYEPLVTRNVYKAEPEIVDHEIGEADVNRNPALLFFFEPVCIDAGERFNKSRLAVVDVSCSADDDVFHLGSLLELNIAQAYHIVKQGLNSRCECADFWTSAERGSDHKESMKGELES